MHSKIAEVSFNLKRNVRGNLSLSKFVQLFKPKVKTWTHALSVWETYIRIRNETYNVN
jgi:hypothetical protein